MAYLFGTILADAAAPETLPAAPAEKSACLAVPASLFLSPPAASKLTAYLHAGGRVLVTDAVEPGVANQIFREGRGVRIAFVRNFRTWCGQMAEAGVREILLPLDVTAIWRQPAILSGLHSLLDEVAGVLLENRLLCRLPLTVPQTLNAVRLADFHRMLVPGAYSWHLTAASLDENASCWSEALRFYADSWTLPAEADQLQCEGFLRRAGRCAPAPVKVYQQTTAPVTTEQELLPEENA